jgi:cytochrome c553
MKSLIRCAAVAAALACLPAIAGEPAKAAVCAACHGPTGVSPIPMYPHLAGQYASYLEHSLREYRSGARKDPVMASQVAGLTDAEIRELAAWYAAQQGPLYTPALPGR